MDRLGVGGQVQAAGRIDKATLTKHLDKPSAITFDVCVILGLVGLLEPVAIAVSLCPWTQVHTADVTAQRMTDMLASGTGAQVFKRCLSAHFLVFPWPPEGHRPEKSVSVREPPEAHRIAYPVASEPFITIQVSSKCPA